MEIVNLKNDTVSFKITDLRAGVKGPNRVNVFLGGKFAFSLTIAQVADFKLKVGQMLSQKDIDEIQAASDFGKLYQRTLEYALSRPHSEKEIRDYLKRKKIKREIEQKRYEDFVEKMKNDPEYREKVREIRANAKEKNKKIAEKDFTEDNRFEYQKRVTTGLPRKPGALFSDDDIEKVVAKLVEVGIINDENFARFFVENRNRIKGTSERKLMMELKQKGISEGIIKEVLAPDEFGEKARDDSAEIEKMIERKRRRGYDDNKLFQYLLRQGFSYDLIKESLRIEE